ncbi:MAG: hypothetical protein WAW11_04055 [Patescibacteria group bacterium]
MGENISEKLSKHKKLMIDNGMTEEQAERVITSFQANATNAPTDYSIPQCRNMEYNDPVLDWINQYALSQTTINRQYTVFTSKENLKKIIELGLDKKCYVRDYSGYLLEDGSIFFISIYFGDFKAINDNGYKIIFSFSRQRPDICINGQVPIGSYFADIDAIKLNNFLKEKGLITENFDFEFEIKKTWEEALIIFRSLFD